MAIESAGIVLVRSDPRDVVGAIELPRAAYRKMIQNLGRPPTTSSPFRSRQAFWFAGVWISP